MPSRPKISKPPWVTPKPKTEDNKGWSGNGFYQSSAWRNARASQLTAHPLCAECYKHNIIEPATVVDHKTRIEDGGSRLEPSNLQSLCVTCHNSKSAYESHFNRPRG